MMLRFINYIKGWQYWFKCIVEKRHLPAGRYRAFLIDAYAAEISEGNIKVVLNFVLVSHVTGSSYKFEETIVDHVDIAHSVEFFNLLKHNHIDFEEYDELVGMVFDTNVVYDIYDKKAVPILTNKTLVACPCIV